MECILEYRLWEPARRRGRLRGFRLSYSQAEEIADKEIGLWKMCAVPLPKTDNPLLEWKRCEESL